MTSTEEYIRIWKSTGAELRKPIDLGNGLVLIKINSPHKITILRQYGNFPWKLNHSDIWTWFDGQKNFSLPTKSKSIWVWLGKIFECEMMMLGRNPGDRETTFSFEGKWKNFEIQSR